MTDPFATLFNDIGFDYEAALYEVETDGDGVRHWRDVVFAYFLGYRPLTLYVSVPRAASPPPLVVFIHGGGWQIGHPTLTHSVYAKLDAVGKLLRAGFAVARISYRLSVRGDVSDATARLQGGGAFPAQPRRDFGIDPRRFAAMGDSAGGHLAALVGLTAGRADLEGEVGDKTGSSAVQAVVDWFAPVDFLTMREQALPDGMKGQDDAEFAGVPADRRPNPANARRDDRGLASHVYLEIRAALPYPAWDARPARSARAERGLAQGADCRRRRIRRSSKLMARITASGAYPARALSSAISSFCARSWGRPARAPNPRSGAACAARRRCAARNTDTARPEHAGRRG